jgi:hypothetical protein
MGCVGIGCDGRVVIVVGRATLTDMPGMHGELAGTGMLTQSQCGENLLPSERFWLLAGVKMHMVRLRKEIQGRVAS